MRVSMVMMVMMVSLPSISASGESINLPDNASDNAAATPTTQMAVIPLTQHPEKMVVRTGKALPQNNQTSIVLPSACACKNHCLVSPPCAAWSSASLTNHTVTCTTTTLPPDTITPLNDNNTVYGFKIGKLTSGVGVLEDTDGTVYIKAPNKMNFHDAKSYCARIPGFHLIMLKNKLHYSHVSYFNSIAKGAFLNLQKTDSEHLQWGDGTFMAPEEIDTYIKEIGHSRYIYFQFLFDSIQYIKVEGTRHVVCQGNTQGVW